VEPDIVPTRDGVLVLRHENEISGTTDVAEHPEFAGRRTMKVIDGATLTGWFTEDFTWAELSRLRARERLPEIRPDSATFDGLEGMLRLSDLVELIDAASATGPQRLMVAELKHASYFASIGLPLDELFTTEIGPWATPNNLIIESFEQTVLAQVRARGVAGRVVYLLEESGSPADAPGVPYADQLTDAGLAGLAAELDGISVDKALLLTADATGATTTTDLVERAHAAGLQVFTWTLRAENRFLRADLQRGSSPSDFGRWLEEFRLILSTGVDGVFADQPDLVVEALRR
jgi:glycerophosphoryl diester phosphodiesterase